MDDSDLEIFKLQIAEPALQWDEMEPALRDKLRLSEQARADFLAVRRRTDLRAYDPKEGRFTEEAATNRRHDFEATSSDTVMEGLDPQLNEAMLRYHSNNVLPNLTKLFEQCGIFYGQVMQETSMQQMTNERIAAQPRSKALNDPVQTAQAQVAYVLDARYSRRYCCLLLLCEEHYTAILERWHGAFSQRMTSTMNLIQALRRAVIDRTTTTRPTYDKAFDVSNVAFHHHSFPYPIFSNEDASLSRCRWASFPTGFQDYGVSSEDFGNGAAKNKSSKGGKGKGSNKGFQSKGSQRLQGQMNSKLPKLSQVPRLLERVTLTLELIGGPR